MRPRPNRPCMAALVAAALALGASAPAEAASKSRQLRWIHVGHIGAKGSGPGKFPGETAGVAVDQDCGDVFIADPVDRRIERFSMTGKSLGSFGESAGVGSIEDPRGMEIRQPFTGRQNMNGPPPPCGPITTTTPALLVTDHGSSQTTGRLSFFGLTGSFDGAWCERAREGCTHSGTLIPAGNQKANGIDPYPNDVDAVGDRIWMTGSYDGHVREYRHTDPPTYIRKSDSNYNYPTGPGGISVSPGALFLLGTDDSASRAGIFDLNPVNETINLIGTIGGGGYDSKTPGKFGYPRAVEIGREGPFFDDMYVLDSDRVQVFTPGGESGALITQPELRHVIELPGDNYRARYLDVRYDGTIYVTGVDSAGADVYSPGVLITLRAKALSDRRIRLRGRIFPPHARRRVKLERLDSGWDGIGRAPLKDGSRFEFVWRAPRRGKTYAFRAQFADPHAYHADRASGIVQEKAKG